MHPVNSNCNGVRQVGVATPILTALLWPNPQDARTGCGIRSKGLRPNRAVRLLYPTTATRCLPSTSAIPPSGRTCAYRGTPLPVHQAISSHLNVSPRPVLSPLCPPAGIRLALTGSDLHAVGAQRHSQLFALTHPVSHEFVTAKPPVPVFL